ncbi:MULTISPECIES: hypothetical protein [Methylorubrum]|uniref:hypothetical protein n=1 Tax=Methylorubrum TaxID=2282523 RepID=UPI00209E8392|nr:MULTISPECIES: hypothetical protein [Methylorubrum]MCP1550714.1 hypothetical protein [Methylorubrum zatmanii]MCP1552673.1 hypothetical protein [Methylorubrum extorquens]MCP1581017.1 hypothetical protein [Methylorubrum extorquens]
MTKPATESAPPAMLDLAEFDLQSEAERGAAMPVANPRTGEKTGATLQVYGADARAYRVALRRIRDAAAREMEREPTDEDDALILGRARSAAAAITGWSGIALKGEPVDYSPEAAVEVLKAYPWLADQVLAYTANRGNFGKV